MSTGQLDGVELAQRQWASVPLQTRAALAGRLARRIADQARELAETIPTNLPGALERTVADSLGAEVLLLIEACRFLKREATGILRTRRLSRTGRPAWLFGVETEIERAPFGVVLVIAAANYPLLLAGVQTLQALIAGNAVLWKPAAGTEAPAFALRRLILQCGLPPELLTILDSSVESAKEVISSGVDHVVLTGSAETGKAVLRQLAETLTPATMELSGCDAVFILPGAELDHTVRALTFGQRFNGSFTCMAPRRVFLVGIHEDEAAAFEYKLRVALAELPPVRVPTRTLRLLQELVADALHQGATLSLNGVSETKGDESAVTATMITCATPALRSMQADIFAPILSVMKSGDWTEALAASTACPYALTAAIFGPEAQARQLASQLRVGNVLINDIVVPTSDPRVAFGGRGRSGFGVTRGVEGLLAMTTPRTIQMQRIRSRLPYEPTGEDHAEFFNGFALAIFGTGLGCRISGWMRMIRAARKLK